MSEPIILSHMCSPGDIICMTALVRDIARAYPDRYSVEVFTSCPSLWDNNPYVSRVLAAPRPGVPFYELNYGPMIREADVTPLHFLTAFHRAFERMTGIHVPVTEPKPDLHLSGAEKNKRLIDGRYWLMFAGGKADFTVKIWSAQSCQRVVNGLAPFGVHVVQTGATYAGNWHPPLSGVLNIIGQAGLRDTLRLLYHADGVMCPITFGMHAAAAFDRPCVVWAGGREHWWWEAYVNHPTLKTFGPKASGNVKVPHRYLHTQGLLDCCKSKGCWTNKVHHGEPDKNRLYCKYPEDDGYGQLIPRCQKMITPHHVIDAVLSYYKDGTLEPIGPAPKVFLPSGQEMLPESLIMQATPVPPAGERFFSQQPDALFSPEAGDVCEKPSAVPKIVGRFAGQANYVAGANQAGITLNMEDPMDNKIIGGKFTVCVLMFGDYHELHRKCLGSIMGTMPQHRREIRVACNAVCDSTRQWLDGLRRDGFVHQLYVNAENIHKVPAMRQLFHDPEHPLTTPYVVWFDDNAIADKDPQWWAKLAQTIINYHQKDCRMFGPLLSARLPIPLVKSQAWYKGRPFRLHNGMAASNGDKALFAHGAFWALSAAAIKELDLPAPSPAEDWVMGEQLWQAGYGIHHWNGQRQFVSHVAVRRQGAA